jgi:transcription elongation factor GreA
MAGEEVYLTREGYKSLMEELKYLQTTRRKALMEEIAEARAHGDLSENAEYDAAKDAQSLNEKRIAELEMKLARARIIDDLDIPADRVFLGATVTLKNLDTGDEVERTLVPSEEADAERGRISVASPIAKGLLGHKEGDEVEIKVPARVVRYKIMRISR